MELNLANRRALLTPLRAPLGCITQYSFGPFGLQDEMRLAQRFDCRTIVTGGRGPAGLKGSELKAGVQDFIEKMKPHLEVAEETGDLDFGPLLSALKQMKYSGWTEIFMHPVPRGIPILETASAVTAEINRSRDYLNKLLSDA